jgi:aspartate oxidase
MVVKGIAMWLLNKYSILIQTMSMAGYTKADILSALVRQITNSPVVNVLSQEECVELVREIGRSLLGIK